MYLLVNSSTLSHDLLMHHVTHNASHGWIREHHYKQPEHLLFKSFTFFIFET